MRRTLPISVVVLLSLQTACEREEATAPQRAPVRPTAQVVDGSTVPSRIAFHAFGPCCAIYVMAADGSALTQLTVPGFDFEPQWSPDGRQIAFTKWLSGERRLAEIHVMTADGSARTRLTNDTTEDADPSWSPDGQRIAFRSHRDGNAEIYVMNADGLAPVRLTNDPAFDGDPSWSPDGGRIAFTSSRDGNSEIYVMGADGSAPARLTNHPGEDTNPSWSPDGRRIAFTSTRDGNAEVYVMNADGSAPTPLTNHPASDKDPSWSPSGLIAFASNRDGNDEIYVMHADGSAQTRLTNRRAADQAPAWGPWLDRTPPQLTLLDISRQAERWFGSVQSYAQPLPTDDFDPNPDLACTPPPGSLFPIGTTQVACTATDEAGNTSSASFSLTIRGPYEELGLVVDDLEGLIASRLSQGLRSARLEDALTKVEGAREELARTPPDRTAALGQLEGVVGNLEEAVSDGELSPFGYDIIVRVLISHAARLAADQAIAEAKARGGNAEVIAEAEAALAKGDQKRAAREFTDAVAQYRKACKTATGA
jgi:hypothetical protein